MTTPTRSMARMAHSPPRPPPSAARLGQEWSSIPPGCKPEVVFTPMVGVVSSIMRVVPSYSISEGRVYSTVAL